MKHLCVCGFTVVMTSLCANSQATFSIMVQQQGANLVWQPLSVNLTKQNDNRGGGRGGGDA